MIEHHFDVSERDGTDFNLAYIPESFKVLRTKQFDAAYMRQLYEFGFAQAAAGYHWAKRPPALAGEGESDTSP